MKPPLIRQGEGPVAAFARIAEEREAQRKKLNRMIAIANADIPDTMPQRPGSTPAGDARRLRGIPAIGRSVAGAIPGTSPHSIR